MWESSLDKTHVYDKIRITMGHLSKTDSCVPFIHNGMCADSIKVNFSLVFTKPCCKRLKIDDRFSLVVRQAEAHQYWFHLHLPCNNVCELVCLQHHSIAFKFKLNISYRIIEYSTANTRPSWTAYVLVTAHAYSQ